GSSIKMTSASSRVGSKSLSETAITSSWSTSQRTSVPSIIDSEQFGQRAGAHKIYSVTESVGPRSSLKSAPKERETTTLQLWQATTCTRALRKEVSPIATNSRPWTAVLCFIPSASDGKFQAIRLPELQEIM